MSDKCPACRKNEAAKLCEDCGFRFCATCLAPCQITLYPKTEIIQQITAKRILCPSCTKRATQREEGAHK